MEKINKVLLIPDAYLGNASGAIVAQVAKKLLLENGNEVSIFSCDIINEITENDGTKLYPRIAYNGMANWKEEKYIKEYEEVLKKSGATAVFTIGSITNKNLCYLEIAKKRGLKVISKIFMQDFFCTKLYANNAEGPCTKCLDYNYLEAFKNKCIIHKPIDYIKTANAIFIRKRLGKILPKIDYVITSTDEQIGFYQKFGIPKEKCVKTPLYFDNNRLKEIKPIMGDYFVCIAQNRIEKGFQYLEEILYHCNPSIKIVAAYNNKEQAIIAIKKYGFQKFIDNGMLEIKHDLRWENGLAEMVAHSRGVIIPSIWPTTTEFGLLEALGYQKPVFCFDIGVHHEVIKNGINGFIAALGDCKTMATQLLQIKSDNEFYLSVSNNAGLLYKEMTDWNGWKNKLIEIGL
jgi:glycosyltransferase involved in cell wall biosynthesis